MSYRVELRWKEEVLYWEDRRGFAFDAGWGSTPPTLYVPSGTPPTPGPVDAAAAGRR